ncbi:MAG: thioredoxin-like domain-containing protein [Pseudomonadota bacterium]
MNELLIAAVVILWVLVLVLAVAVFALARQVGVLYERVAPAGALMVNQQLKPEDDAPVIEVESLNGHRLSTGVSDLGQLLFFLAPDCPICKTLLPVLKSIQRSEGAFDIVLVSDGDDEATHRAFVEEAGLQSFPYILSEIVGRSFGVGKLPYGVLIDNKGKIASLGIVNTREHLESLFEAHRMGVASIQAYLGTDEGQEGDKTELHYDATVKG